MFTIGYLERRREQRHELAYKAACLEHAEQEIERLRWELGAQKLLVEMVCPEAMKIRNDFLAETAKKWRAHAEHWHNRCVDLELELAATRGTIRWLEGDGQ